MVGLGLLHREEHDGRDADGAVQPAEPATGRAYARPMSSGENGPESGPGVAGLFVAQASPRPLASLLGLTPEPVRKSILPPGSAVYMTALDYAPAVERAAGREFDPDAWLSVLLCQYTRDEHLAALATLNHFLQDPDLASAYQQDLLGTASPELAVALRAALRGDTGIAAGKPRVLLARPVVLRAIRLVAHLSPRDDAALAEAARLTGRDPRAFAPLTCATMLTHAIAVGLGAHARRADDEPQMGGLPESLAIETICSGAFVRQGNQGNMLARTLLLYRDYGPRITEPLRLPPLELAEQALGMPLLQALALGFSYFAQSGSQTTGRTVDVHPLRPPDRVEQASPGSVAAFLDRFAGTADDLAAAAEAARLDWQNLHLQERPLLLRDGGALVLDESLLIERLTTGLFFLVLEHERSLGGDRAAYRWRAAYGQMHEMLVEDYLTAWAPAGLGGLKTTFDEDDLQRVYDPANKGGGRIDLGIDYGTSVLLADAVSGQLSVKTRELAQPDALKADLDRIVVGKARQLAGSFDKVTRDPQPPEAPVGQPARAVHAIVVPGGQFPQLPVMSRLLNELFAEDQRVAAMLDDARCLGLSVLDLRDLEHAEALRSADTRSLPELLAAWRADPTWHETSLSDFLLATVPDQATQTTRPAGLARPLQDVFEAIDDLLIGDADSA